MSRPRILQDSTAATLNGFREKNLATSEQKPRPVMRKLKRGHEQSYKKKPSLIFIET